MDTGTSESCRFLCMAPEQHLQYEAHGIAWNPSILPFGHDIARDEMNNETGRR